MNISKHHWPSAFPLCYEQDRLSRLPQHMRHIAPSGYCHFGAQMCKLSSVRSQKNYRLVLLRDVERDDVILRAVGFLRAWARSLPATLRTFADRRLFESSLLAFEASSLLVVMPSTAFLDRYCISSFDHNIRMAQLQGSFLRLRAIKTNRL
jgi:hypothetical protein